MGLPSLALLLASMSFGEPAVSNRAGSIERIVVVLGQNDPVVSSRVLRQMKSCTDGTPTAVVSAFGALRVELDFTTDPDALFAAISLAASPDAGLPGPGSGSSSLAARLPPEKTGAARSLAASLQLLAEALAPVGPTTVIVLVSPGVGAEWGTGVNSSAGLSPYYRSSEGEPVSTTDLGYETVTIPWPVIEARRALRRVGLTLVAVNTSGRYDAAVKALTEVPGGRYLRSSQREFPKALVSAVCAPGR